MTGSPLLLVKWEIPFDMYFVICMLRPGAPSSQRFSLQLGLYKSRCSIDSMYLSWGVYFQQFSGIELAKYETDFVDSMTMFKPQLLFDHLMKTTTMSELICEGGCCISLTHGPV